MDREWVAWLAGFTEGEGTIGLSSTRSSSLPGKYLRPHYQVVNTNLALLEKAADIVEEITQKRPSIVIATKGTAKWKQSYRLAVHTQWELEILLPVLLPFLVSKAEQAQLVLSFCKRRSERYVKRWYEFKDEDEAGYRRCLALNRRGTSVESGGENSSAAPEG